LLRHQPSSALLVSDFETAAAGTTWRGGPVDGWVVKTNKVTVLNNPLLANTGSRSLSLRSGGHHPIAADFLGPGLRSHFAYRKVPTLDGLIAWWPGEGNGADIVGGHNGALLNGVSFGAGEVLKPSISTESMIGLSCLIRLS